LYYRMSNKELLIVWTDIQIFEIKKDDTLVDEILDTILKGITSKKISEGTLKNLYSAKEKGAPYPIELFIKVKVEIFEVMHSENYLLFVEYCNLASIYSKRRWDIGISLPDQAFDRLIQEADLNTTDWKLRLDKNGIKVHEKTRTGPNYCIRDEAIVNAPADMLVDLVWAKRAEYDKLLISVDMLEKINEDTNIYHLKFNSPFLMKNKDAVALLSKKKAADGSIMLLCTKCEHPKAQETKEFVRMEGNLVGNILIPLSSTSTLFVGIVQWTDKGNKLDLFIQEKLMKKIAYKTVKIFRGYAEKLYAQSKTIEQ